MTKEELLTLARTLERALLGLPAVGIPVADIHDVAQQLRAASRDPQKNGLFEDREEETR